MPSTEIWKKTFPCPAFSVFGARLALAGLLLKILTIAYLSEIDLDPYYNAYGSAVEIRGLCPPFKISKRKKAEEKAYHFLNETLAAKLWQRHTIVLKKILSNYAPLCHGQRLSVIYP